VQLSVLVPAGRQGAVEAVLRRRALEVLAERDIKIDTRISVKI
jgi:hypothetical protein